MTEWLIGLSSALWFGILTSISPCPLASNIAAISFLSKKIAHPGSVFISGLAYTLGRMLAYAALGFLIIGSFLSVPLLANFLQKYMNRIFGPAMVLTGLILLDLIRFNIPAFSLSEERQGMLVRSGAIGDFFLGFVFALVFCPVSAALFFGSLITLALNNKAGAALPFVYGIGTGLPVFVFSVMIALGVTSLGIWFERVRLLEVYMRRVTGAVFLIVGIYYVSIYLLKIGGWS